MADRTVPDQELFERSGKVFAATPLVSFLYSLMIDHLTPGQVERLVRESADPGTTTYTNGWVAEYAKDVATRLQGGPVEIPATPTGIPGVFVRKELPDL